METAPLIRDLAVILGVAGIVTLLFQKVRQPVVLGYIVAGMIVGPHFLGPSFVSDVPNIRVWAELGVIFLMFSLGLEFSFRKLMRVGVSASITASFEMSMMMLLGFFAGKALLKWPFFDSLFLGAMLSVSSTTIILKALDEMKLRTRRFAEMIIGVLVVEDLVAILVLVALSTVAATKLFSGLHLLMAAFKLILVVTTWFLTGYLLLPRFVRYVGRLGSDEMLTITSIGLCLILVVVASMFHYSMALGAFIMGSILAESTESHRIEELIRPLQSVFSAVFFVSVGMLIDPHIIIAHAGTVALVAALLIVGKITFISLGALITGQTLRTSMQMGFGMAQIGEFSFIIAGLGQALSVTSPSLYPIAVAVSILTAFTTPYLIRFSHRIAVALEKRLPLQVKNGLSKYAVWTQGRKADAAKRSDFYRRSFRWVLNAILVIVTFILCGELLLPYLEKSLNTTPNVLRFGCWLLGILLSAPFIWGMFFSFRDFRFGAYAGHGVLFLSRFFVVLCMGLLSLEFFTIKLALVVTFAIAAIFFISFRHQLEASYRWFEKSFLSNFEEKPKSQKATDVLKHLAPWDAHLVRFKVHPNSELVGKKLQEIDLRSRYGMNIVVIQRGLKTIVAPLPTEIVYPKDELLVLGTDDQIDLARAVVEKPPGLEERFRHLSGYSLRHVLVNEESSLMGVSIRASGIRENTGGMVVGIERGERRIINPNSDLVLENGDVLWVVGETEKVKVL